jgi:hypothetical protein
VTTSVAVEFEPDRVYPRPARLKWYVLDVFPAHDDVGHHINGHVSIRRHWEPHRRRFSCGSDDIEVQVVDKTFWFVVVPENSRLLKASTFPGSSVHGTHRV